MKDVIVDLIVNWVLYPPFAAFLGMHAVGVIHGEGMPELPTIGYLPSLAVSFLVKGVLWFSSRGPVGVS